MDKSQGGGGDKNSANASHKKIEPSQSAQFAAKRTQPMQGFRLPGLVQMIQEGRGSQDHEKDAAHVLQGLYTQVFDIPSGFLVKPISLLNVGAVAPGEENSLSLVRAGNGALGQQSDVTVQVRVVNGKEPQRLRLLRQV